MHKMKKRLGILVALTLVTTTLLAGCGLKDSGTSATTESTTQATTTSTTEELKPVELTWYAIGTPQKDQQVVIDEMNKTIKTKLNATLKMNVIDWGTYNDKMKVIMAGGDPYDICFTATWSNNFVGNVAKGAFLEIDELIQKYGKNILEQMPASYWDAMKVKGKTYGIYNLQTTNFTNGYYVRKDLVDKYAFDYKSVKKLQDLEPFVKQVSEGEKGKYTASTSIIDGDTPPYNLETGVKYFAATSTAQIPLYITAGDNDFKVINVYETADRMQNLKTSRDWYQKEYIKKDQGTIKDTSNDKKAGKYSMVPAGTIKPGGDAEFASRYGYEVVQVPIAPGIARTDDVQATLLSISKNAPNPERAMMLIDLLWGDKALYNTLCFGIEGRHYNKIDDVTVEPIKDSAYNPTTDWEFGCQFNAFFRKGQAKDTWDITKKANEEATKSPLLGYVFDREPVKNEAAAVEAIANEYEIPLFCGAIDPEKHVPIMLKKMKDAGIDKIAAEAQKQIKEWKVASGK